MRQLQPVQVGTLLTVPMIVVASNNDTSDAASTNTLVIEQKIPRHLPTFIYLSFVVSTLAFIFAIVDNVYNRWSNVPQGVVVTILAYVSTLPHHGSTILLHWLERHQSESIFSFNPSSRRAIGFSILCCGLWAGSTAVCARNLYLNSRTYQTSACFPNHASSTGYKCVDYTFHPSVDSDYGNSLASTITSAVETLLVLSVTTICWAHRRRLDKSTREATPSNITTPSQSKVLPA